MCNASLQIESLNLIIQPSDRETSDCLFQLGFQPLPDIPQLVYQYVRDSHLAALIHQINKMLSDTAQGASRFFMTRSPVNAQSLLLGFLKAQPLSTIAQAVKHAWFFQVLVKEQLYFDYQPIFDLASGEVVAHECLARAKESQGRAFSGKQLIDAAVATQLTCDFDNLARSLCIKSIATAPNDLKFFINVLPNTIVRYPHLLEHNLKQVLDLGLQPQKIVFELTEVESLLHSPQTLQAINRIREWGFGIAVDDLCSGVSTDNYFLEFRPDAIKIDRRIIHGCSQRSLKQILLKSLLDCAHELGILVVAEGLEELDDIQFCRELGVDLGQGFGLARPERTLRQEALDLVIPVSGAS